MEAYKRNNNQVYLLNYHVIWTPKRRKAVLRPEIAIRLRELFDEVAEENGFEIKACAIALDHVHVFISGQPQLSVHKTIKKLKGRSSNKLRKEFPELLKLPTMWTNSYFVSTTGNACSETISIYIKDQKGR